MTKTLISTPLTLADGSVSVVDVTSGIDGTYDVYEFHFYNIHSASDSVEFTFQMNAASGANTTGFDQIITSGWFEANHQESDGGTELSWRVVWEDNLVHQYQGDEYQSISRDHYNDEAESSMSGVLTIYAPSSTTYVKNFAGLCHNMMGAVNSGQAYVNAAYAFGYINAEEAMDEISFKFTSGNIDSGVIKMFGVS